jgi:hypothetical protein
VKDEAARLRDELDLEDAATLYCQLGHTAAEHGVVRCC